VERKRQSEPGLGFVEIRQPAVLYFFDSYKRSRDRDHGGEPFYEQPITAEILEIDPMAHGQVKDGTYLRIRTYNAHRSNPTAVIFDHQIMRYLPDQIRLFSEVEERSR
jgi:hypothetical protein